MLHVMLWEGWIDRRLHRRAHPRLRCAEAARARLRAQGRQQALRHRRAATCVQAARWFANVARRRSPAADALALLPGAEPEHERHGEERGADQPAPGHRPDRQAGRRAVLAHRPAERDGRARGRRHGQPAVGAPRSRQCRASRRGRAPLGRGRRAGRGRARPRSRCSRRPPTGEIKALWIACTNPAQSMPDQATVRRALERCEFVVVQEAFATTATCAYADLLLPATTWGEKDGTVTNSERRISRVRAGRRRARRSARRLGDRRRLRAPPGGAARSAAARRRRFAVRLPGPAVGLERASRIDPRPRPRHHRPELRRARRARPRSGRGPKARAEGTEAPLRRRRLRHRRRPRALRRRAVRAAGRGARRALSVRRSTPGGCATSGTA